MKTKLTIKSIKDNLITLEGQYNFEYLEIVDFKKGIEGVVLKANLTMAVAAILNLSNNDAINVGGKATPTGKLYKMPIYNNYLGSIIDILGQDILSKFYRNGKVEEYRDIFADAQPIFTRKAVSQPLETGIVVIDGVIPIGRGQKELIIGDRGTGKTSIAINALLAQKENDVINIYVSIGKKREEVIELYGVFEKYGIVEKTIMVAAASDDTAASKYLIAYAGMSIAEYYQQVLGKDVLIIFDDLTNHADAYRELSLLSGAAPGREAYPGDVFYTHSRLLERGGRYLDEYGGGSITVLPIAQTLAGDISGYIPTNLISITDGQIYTSTKLFNQGTRPAIDVGLSVSRLGSQAQTPLMIAASAGLKNLINDYQYQKKLSSFNNQLTSFEKKKQEKGRAFELLIDQEEYEVLNYETTAMILFLLKKGYLSFYGEKAKELKLMKNILKIFWKKDVLGKKMKSLLSKHKIESKLIMMYIDRLILPLLKYHLLTESKWLATNESFIELFKDIRNDGRVLLNYERKGLEKGVAYEYK